MSDPRPSGDEDEPSGLQAQLSALMSGLNENTERLRQCKEDYETKMAACAEKKAEKDSQVEEMRTGLHNLISARTEDSNRNAYRQATAGPTWADVSHQLRENHEHFVDAVRVLAEESRHSRERAHAELLHALRDRRSTPSE